MFVNFISLKPLKTRHVSFSFESPRNYFISMVTDFLEVVGLHFEDIISGWSRSAVLLA